MAKKETAPNPYAQRAARMRSLLSNTITDEDVQGIAGAIVKRAKEGDLTAAKLVLSYVVGTPEAPQDPDAVELAGIKMQRDRELETMFP